MPHTTHTQSKTLRRAIMRRVYYAFGIRIATHPIVVHAAILAIAGYALASLVFVERVLQNIASTPVADLGSKLLSIILAADALTLLVLGIAIFAALSLPLRLPRSHVARGWSMQSV